jgi:hypothetical protein
MNFALSKEGTAALRYFLLQISMPHHNPVVFHQYVLGCCIYHQLHYESNISCSYEL